MKNNFIETQYDADENGHFGEFGGMYVPEILIPALEQLSLAYREVKKDKNFYKELQNLYQNYSGRPTPLYFAENLTHKLGGAKIYIKNEGQNLTGAHKINHCLGQALVAKKLGKKRLIAETGAGQHGLATATVAAKFGFKCTVYMGEIDYERQRPNVFWMELLGAEVVAVKHGTRRLKDAVTAAIQDWITNIDESYFLLGSALGPHPYPSMVRDFQSIVGLEVIDQLIKYQDRNYPDYVVACVGGGSNSIGIFNTFLDNKKVKLIGVEAGGKDITKPGEHAARLQTKPKVGIVEGYKSFFLQNNDGQLQGTHSISAGLDYAGIGPQHALLFKKGRVEYKSASDKEALGAVKILAESEGLIPALESAHAIAYVIKLAPTLNKKQTIVVNMSGRGDKDLFILTDKFKDEKFKEFLKNLIKN